MVVFLRKKDQKQETDIKAEYMYVLRSKSKIQPPGKNQTM